jgi:SsrA-binding protein
MAKKPKKKQNDNTIARNRKARYDYTIESTFEGGLVLEGWEVKSLREGKAQIDESYIFAKNGELEWVGGTITPLIMTSTHIHPSPTRSRKILMHRHEIDRLIGSRMTLENAEKFFEEHTAPNLERSLRASYSLPA